MKMICPKHKICGYDKKWMRCNPHNSEAGCKCSLDVIGQECPPCIPYIREFKIGDKVQVLGRTLGCGNGDYFKTLETLGIRLNSIHKIDNIPTCKCSCGSQLFGILTPDGTRYLFHQQDLELIAGDDKIMNENKPKYKATGKTLHLAVVIRYSRITNSEFDSLCNWVHKSDNVYRHADLMRINGFIEYAEKHGCFIKWLIENEYIEKVEPEIFYKLGDKFERLGSGKYCGFEFILASPENNTAMLINTNDGGRWTGGIKVKNITKITEMELSEMCGLGNEWKKI